jgi:ribosome-binding protein aMBF1 (putative translation factor)
MLASFRSEDKKILTQELQEVSRPLPVFDRDLSAKIGKCIAVRRTLCGLSKQQLAVRLGIDSADAQAYEQGEKRMSCKLLLETAKQLKAAPRFFFG